MNENMKKKICRFIFAIKKATQVIWSRVWEDGNMNRVTWENPY